ncbi:YgfZ/GcvT domain-containing protein [Armatimonas rosea]|uniref:Folate-binding protein YgfZ n=1 Tax=Armatimonas rosea TaxID=685828 RepID=A0A7W9SS04_ARMRO|nr:folate-binding protein YgfZ [Armatimonas rosea]MBB6050998.1 folate-binding protein YgfZ [Armatimonas rosea]
MTLPECFYLPLERDLLRLTGRDRQSFLQGMVTNEIASLTPGQGCYAFHLTSKGQILADCRVACLEDSLLIDTEPGWGTPLAESLDHHLVMERVKITPLTGILSTFVGGEEAEEILRGLQLLPEPGEGSNVTQSFVGQQVIVVRTHWIAGTGFMIYASAETMAIVHDSAGELLDSAVFEGLRIEAGIPKGRVDFDEKTLAPETGQASRAIHYKKGCYIGQEVVARIDARGHTNRGFVRLTLDALVAPGTKLYTDGKEVGWLTSVAPGPTLGEPRALGYLRNEFAAPGTQVAVGESGMGVVV